MQRERVQRRAAMRPRTAGFKQSSRVQRLLELLTQAARSQLDAYEYPLSDQTSRRCEGPKASRFSWHTCIARSTGISLHGARVALKMPSTYLPRKRSWQTRQSTGPGEDGHGSERNALLLTGLTREDWRLRVRGSRHARQCTL
ncbi:hypothetical protein FKP32DRAFT_584889 [Trametes sanguinea]|nr:hypothetical protein FKP32DRAFT_584889 [Trametes sanguinea]